MSRVSWRRHFALKRTYKNFLKALKMLILRREVWSVLSRLWSFHPFSFGTSQNLGSLLEKYWSGEGQTEPLGTREDFLAFLYRSTWHIRLDKASLSDQIFLTDHGSSWLPLEAMGSERHFHQVPFPPFSDTYSSSIHPFLGMSVPDASRNQDCISHIYRDRSSAQSGTCLSSHVVAEQAWGHRSVLCLVSPTHAPSELSSQLGYGYLPVQKQTCPWGSHTWCASASCTWSSPFVHPKTAGYELARIYHSWLILPNRGFSCTWHLPMDDKRRGFSSLQLPNLKTSSPLWLHSLYFGATVGHLYHEDWVLMQCKTKLIPERLVEKDQSLFKHSQCGWHCGEPSLHTIV